LVQPLTREIQIGETTYHVTMHPDRVAIRQKGRRSSIEVSWTELLAFEQRMQAPIRPSPPLREAKSCLTGILNEVAQQLRAATEFLSRADDTLTQAGAPGGTLAQAAADRVTVRSTRNTTGSVTLLTPTEVASFYGSPRREAARLRPSELQEKIGTSSR
jgi:hypothetical protein